MEEIVHKYRNHVPTGLREVLPGLRTRTYNHAQEAEAYGVGAAALLPWSTFYHDLDAGTAIPDIAEAYDVSTQLVEYRIKITGATNLVPKSLPCFVGGWGDHSTPHFAYEPNIGNWVSRPIVQSSSVSRGLGGRAAREQTRSVLSSRAD